MFVPPLTTEVLDRILSDLWFYFWPGRAGPACVAALTDVLETRSIPAAGELYSWLFPEGSMQKPRFREVRDP